MAEIPGWAYVIIGVAVSIFSKIVNSKSGDNSMALFYYLGFVLIIIGIGKIIFNIVKKKKNVKHITAKKGIPRQPSIQERLQKQQQNQARQGIQQPQIPAQQVHKNQGQHPHHMSEIQGNNHHINQAKHNPNIQHQSIISCPNCGTRHYATASYCMRCGSRLR